MWSLQKYYCQYRKCAVTTETWDVLSKINYAELSTKMLCFWILNFEISMIDILPFTKKKWIQNTTNLINYTWNIVKNVIVIDWLLILF